MKKIKYYLITFCLILSVLFINITPTYCEIIKDTVTSNRDYKYTLLNTNINPFYVNVETGEGWYYAGYIPQIYFTGYPAEDYVGFHYDSDYVDRNVLMDLLLNSPKDIAIMVGWNGYKTQWYYYDGNSLEIAMTSKGASFENSYADLSEMCIGVNGQEYAYNGLYSNLNTGAYALGNYCILENSPARWAGLGSTYCNAGVYYPSIAGLYENYDYFYMYDAYTSYHTKEFYHFYDFVPMSLDKGIKYYNNHNSSEWYNVDDGDSSLRYLKFNYKKADDSSSSYTHDDHLYFKWDKDTFNSDFVINQNTDILITIDFANTTTHLFDRVYIPYSELCSKLGISRNYNSLDVAIKDIKKLSKNYSAGYYEDIVINGIGFAWYSPKTPRSMDVNIKTLSENFYISNQQYIAFNYESENSIVCGSYKIYSLMTDYSSHTLETDLLPTNEKGTTITEGIDPDFDGNINNGTTGDQNPSDDYEEIYGNFDVTSMLTGVTTTFWNLFTFVGSVPLLFASLFSFFPPEIVSLFGLSFSILFIIALIRYLRG